MRKNRTEKIARKRKNRALIYIIILVVAVIVTCFGIVYVYTTPTNGNGNVTVEIKDNASIEEIGVALKENGIIRSKEYFKIYSKIKGYTDKYKAGKFIFPLPISVDNVSKILMSNPNDVNEVKITIPEGYTVAQIAKTLNKYGLINENKFLDLCKRGDFDYKFLNFKKTDDMKYKLEGFLFPDTYNFKSGESESQIINTMLSRFNDISDKILKGTKPEDHNLTYLSWVTMASMVEKEAVLESERSTIAGIFYKRLSIEMPLQSCATVQFALGKDVYKPIVTVKDTKVDSPYNTYLNLGLPPGPIASPGEECLIAALDPQKTDYLYFVAVAGDGSHIFSKTFAEHEAVQGAK